MTAARGVGLAAAENKTGFENNHSHYPLLRQARLVGVIPLELVRVLLSAQ